MKKYIALACLSTAALFGTVIENSCIDHLSIDRLSPVNSDQTLHIPWVFKLAYRIVNDHNEYSICIEDTSKNIIPSFAQNISREYFTEKLAEPRELLQKNYTVITDKGNWCGDLVIHGRNTKLDFKKGPETWQTQVIVDGELRLINARPVKTISGFFPGTWRKRLALLCCPLLAYDLVYSGYLRNLYNKAVIKYFKKKLGWTRMPTFEQFYAL